MRPTMAIRNTRGGEKSPRSDQRLRRGLKSAAGKISPTLRKGMDRRPREVTIGEVWDGFVELMERKGASEEDFHQYMVRYPALIPVLRPQDNLIYSKFKLGSQ